MTHNGEVQRRLDEAAAAARLRFTISGVAAAAAIIYTVRCVFSTNRHAACLPSALLRIILCDYTIYISI